MPTISDVRHPMLVYDPNTLSLVLWDGSLSVGAVTIGTVNQGTAGVSAWPVTVSGAVTTNPPANQSVNVAQLVGTATAVNSGLKDAGTLRVVLATDQPALTNKLLVTPDSVALPANQSVNVAQMGGVATSMNTGVRDTGTQRVTIATNDLVPVSNADLTTLAGIVTTNRAAVNPIAGQAGVAAGSGAATLATQRVTLATDIGLPAGSNAIGNITSLSQMAGQAIAMGTGVRSVGTQRITVATDDLVPVSGTVTVTPPTLTKNTQGATGFSTQDLKDAGRNQTNYFHAAPIITTVAEVMQTLTGYKGGIAVAATATPAVVTTGKTYRIDQIVVTYWAATVIGGARINLRANLSGVGVVGSPLVTSWQVGLPAAFTAGAASTYTFEFPEGMEFAAGTGIAVGVIGEGAVPTTGTITGYVMIAIRGYEY